MAIVTSILWGITPVMDKLVAARASSTTILTVRFTATFVCILPLFFVPSIRREIMGLDIRTASYMIGGAVLSAIIGLFLYFSALKRLEATKVTPICASYPLVTFILGAALLHEPLTWTKSIGTILTVIGVVLLSL